MMLAKPAMHDRTVRAPTGRETKRTSRRTVFDARQRLTSTSGTRVAFDFDLLHEYASSRLKSMLVIPAVVVVLALFAMLWAPAVSALAWAALVIATNAVVIYLAHRFEAQADAPDARRWTMTFGLAELLHGFAWASLMQFELMVGPSANLSVAMFAMVLVGTATNAVTTSSLPRGTLGSTLPASIALTVFLLLEGGALNFSLAAVLVAGEVFFVYLARKLYLSKLGMAAYQSEKETLITELEEAREMSDEARRHAEQANIAKSQFLATMSHELRTPLNAIIGFSEVLQSELLGPHEVRQYKEYAGDIHRSGQHLLTLINELLDLSRIEAGKYELNEEAISLVDIAEDCRRMLEIRANSKSITLTCAYADDLPKLWGDERATRQVVLNLLSNAIKFTSQSGKVLLKVARSADGGQLISVRDNGPGIPEEEMETVLSSFGQGSLAQKSAEQGAGLGLPIVQKIMELHQGRFDLFSKVRFGTEAIATFPRARVMKALAPVIEDRNRLEIYSDVG
ncbi:sensor histidine kinase [Devosia sp.]|uniref:sensor histidine kinase n=1 Tax=Devosia sp. TaxID=1871048 RepID=UPI003A95C677